jgi:hypothetical protein
MQGWVNDRWTGEWVSNPGLSVHSAVSSKMDGPSEPSVLCFLPTMGIETGALDVFEMCVAFIK